jgi:hypothetical protein
MSKRKICGGLFNSLYATAEEGLQNSWVDLGISLDGKEIEERIKDKEEFKRDDVLPPSYYLYRKHSLYIVNKILDELNIEVEGD